MTATSVGWNMQKKYQVFVSSTFRDLADERQDAIRTILDLGHIPAGMELFPASDQEQLAYIKKVIDECDYYVLIMGARYGSLDEYGVSFTEREYDYAVETGKFVLAFPHGDLGGIPVNKSESADRMRDNLEQFRQKVMKGRLVREWASRDQLDGAITKALVKAMSEFPALGWVRGDTIASESLLSENNGLRKELDSLRAQNRELNVRLAAPLDGLASFDDTFLVEYTHKVTEYQITKTKTGSFSATWGSIFAAIGPSFRRPSVPAAISIGMSSYFKEVLGYNHSITLTDKSRNTIQAHFEILGLLSSHNGAAANGGGIVEWLQVTPAGRQKLLELMAVKAPIAEAGALRT